jgi:hypothetical protein
VAPNSADYESIDRLKTLSLAKVAVNPVQPVDPAAPVNHLSMRGARVGSPSGTFAKYIEEALIRDLKEAGVYAAGATLRIDATVLANDIDVLGFVTGDGTLDIEIAVTLDGKQRLRKTYRATTRFDSNFMGMIALQNGQATYPALVHAALKQIYSDPEFIHSIQN